MNEWKGTDIQNLLTGSNKEVVVLNVWATFCKPCVEEIPHFINICNRYSNHVELILMSVDAKEIFPDKLQRFVKKKRFHRATLGWLHETDANYFCPLVDSRWEGSIPATLIINTQTGRRYFIEGSMTATELTTVLNDFLPKK